MLKDPTEFRERFAKWKLGELVYENGRALPEYEGGKNKFDSFAELLSPIVYQELLLKKNVKNIDKAHDYMMRLLAMESDYGNSPVARKLHNYGGYGWNGKTYTTFKDDLAFVKAYVDLMTSRYIDAVNSDTILLYGHHLKRRGYHETPEDVYTSRLAGMKSMSGAVARHKTANQDLYSLQFPTRSKVPYRNDDYNYYRANQLGYAPDETGHMPTRDYETGIYLKSATHPTIMKSVVTDNAEGYEPYYNTQYKRMASRPNPVKQWVSEQLGKIANIQPPFLPGYELGKPVGTGLFPVDIPSVARNVYRALKERAYRTITPQDYNIPKATKEFISGKNRNLKNMSPAQNEEWAKYLGVPYKGKSSFEVSPYKPQKGKTYDTVLRFKDESEILSDEVLNQMLEHQRKTGKNFKLVDGNGKGLGSYTISLGEDEKGKYISYYDDWDINPFKGISSKIKIPVLSNIEDVVPGSNPFTVYGRRYYTNTRNEPRNK